MMLAVIQKELSVQYRRERGRFRDYVAALVQIVENDFPAENAGQGITRYHVDAVKDLTSRLAALVDGYERR